MLSPKCPSRNKARLMATKQPEGAPLASGETGESQNRDVSGRRTLGYLGAREVRCDPHVEE